MGSPSGEERRTNQRGKGGGDAPSVGAEILRGKDDNTRSDFSLQFIPEFVQKEFLKWQTD